MTLDGFLTFLTLAAAIYAVVSPFARLRAKLGIAIQRPVALIALMLVLYLEFFDVLRQPCPSFLGRACSLLSFPADKSFTPPQAAFVVVLLWMVIAWTIHVFSRPTGGSLPAMSRLIDDLLFEQRFAEILKLVEPHLPLIGRAAQRGLPLQRLHDWIAAYKSSESLALRHVLNDAEQARLPSRVDKFLEKPVFDRPRRWFGRLAMFVPAQQDAEAAGSEIARVLFRSADLRHFIGRMRPYFAMSLLQLDLHDKHDFTDAYFRDLISDPGSILYQELEQNQNMSAREGYLFPERNRLLHFLFADARVAQRLGAWKPIGEYVLKKLRPNESLDYLAYLNGPAEGFDDERWGDPTFAGMFFFDLMVRAAAHQGVQYHMWLYYYPHFVERLVDLYDGSNPAVDESDEFPTRGTRLIYEALSTLRGWVQLVDDLPENSIHRKIQSGYQSDNGNIPISAGIALGSCIARIVMSDRISDRFAAYMHQVVMQGIRNLPREGDQGRMRARMIQCVVQGGQLHPGSCYVDRLITYFEGADYVLQEYLDDYRASLMAARAGPAQ